MYNSINIVIPVYNEGDNILKTISEIEKDIKINHKIFVIYDFDEDNTVPPVKELIKQGKDIQLIKNKYGRGALNAIKTGLESVPEGVILVMMADLSDELSKVNDMFILINDGYDIVCGSRYMRGGKQIGGPLLKKLMSGLAGVSLYYIAGIPTHDITNSFKMYTKKVIEKITIESSGGFELGMEIVVKAHTLGFKVGEVPSVWRDRSAGESKFQLWKWLPNYLHWYWYALRFRLTGKAN